MTKIIAFSGRKQSGKTSSFNLLLGIEMIKLAIVRDKIAVANDGMLWISDLFGDEEYQGFFDTTRDNIEMVNFLNEYVYPYIKDYSFAYHLKKISIDVLGLKPHQVYGTDNDKNEKTHLLWENMPGVVTDKGFFDILKTTEVKGRLGKYYDKIVGTDLIYHEPGPMTAREVTQFVGTEIFRKMYSDVWPDTCLRLIEKENSNFAIITDCRFPNEVEAVKKAGGKVVRLTKNCKNKDVHESERALDPDRYDWNNFDAVIDNEDMTIGEKNQSIITMLTDWGFMDEVAEEKVN